MFYTDLAVNGTKVIVESKSEVEILITGRDIIISSLEFSDYTETKTKQIDTTKMIKYKRKGTPHKGGKACMFTKSEFWHLLNIYSPNNEEYLAKEFNVTPSTLRTWYYSILSLKNGKIPSCCSKTLIEYFLEEK